MDLEALDYNNINKYKNINELDGEIWKPIQNIGIEGYEASNKGRIRTLGKIIQDSKGRTRKFPAKIMSQSMGGGRSKYYQVRFSYDHNKDKLFFVHRLIAETYIPNPDNKPTVNHIDGNKLNNDVNNLEWLSYSENNLHAYKESLKTDNKKIICLNAYDGSLIDVYYSIAEASRLTQIDRNKISDMIANKYFYNNCCFLLLKDFTTIINQNINTRNLLQILRLH